MAHTGGSRRKRTRRKLVAALAIVADAAQAAFPGANGRIAFVQNRTSERVYHLFTVRPDGSDIKQITDGSTSYWMPSWSADGHRLVVDGSDGIVTMAADGSGRQVVTSQGSSPSISPSGKRIVYGDSSSIRTIRVDGTGSRGIVTGRGLGDPQYSPSGKRIAFVGKVGGRKKPGLWSVRRDGSRLHRLAKGMYVSEPDYSPEGRKVAFTRWGWKTPDLRVVRADGSRERGILEYRALAGLAYAPAGNRIAAAAYRLNIDLVCSTVVTFALDGSDERHLTDNCDGIVDDKESEYGRYVGWPGWQPLPE